MVIGQQAAQCVKMGVWVCVCACVCVCVCLDMSVLMAFEPRVGTTAHMSSPAAVMQLCGRGCHEKRASHKSSLTYTSETSVNIYGNVWAGVSVSVCVCVCVC